MESFALLDDEKWFKPILHHIKKDEILGLTLCREEKNWGKSLLKTISGMFFYQPLVQNRAFFLVLTKTDLHFIGFVDGDLSKHSIFKRSDIEKKSCKKINGVMDRFIRPNEFGTYELLFQYHGKQKKLNFLDGPYQSVNGSYSHDVTTSEQLLVLGKTIVNLYT